MNYQCPLCEFIASTPTELVEHAEKEHHLNLYKDKKSAFRLLEGKPSSLRSEQDE